MWTLIQIHCEWETGAEEGSGRAAENKIVLMQVMNVPTRINRGLTHLMHIHSAGVLFIRVCLYLQQVQTGLHTRLVTDLRIHYIKNCLFFVLNQHFKLIYFVISIHMSDQFISTLFLK